MYCCHCSLRCSPYTVLRYWNVDFECRPGRCVFPQHIFHYTKTHFLFFTALAGRKQSRLEGIPTSYFCLKLSTSGCSTLSVPVEGTALIFEKSLLFLL
jgi:hypothetical protein